MAADWIKMRTDLYRDPKVCVMADILMSGDSALARYVNQNMQCDMAVTRNVMRNVTVGALVAVWGVTRHRGKRVGDDLVVYGVTVSVVDDIADLPGFSDAMLAAGWLAESSEGILFPRFFEEHNVDPSDLAKQKNNERQQRHRDKKRAACDSNVTVTHVTHRVEKRRVITPVVPIAFERFWQAFPKKRNKGQAERAWKVVSPDEILQAKILAALERGKASVDWGKEGGKFIPYPATWLNAKGWEDEIESMNGEKRMAM